MPPLLPKAENLPLEFPLESLLLTGDLQDVPCVRSLSSGDLKLLFDLPTEGSQLFDMRKRHMTAEKALPNATDPSVRGEVKRRRNRHLERSTDLVATLPQISREGDQLLEKQGYKNGGESLNADRGSAGAVCQSGTGTGTV